MASGNLFCPRLLLATVHWVHWVQSIFFPRYALCSWCCLLWEFRNAVMCSCHLSVSELQENTKRQEKPRGFSAIPPSAAASATVFGRWFHLLGMEIKPGKDPASSSMDFPLLGTCWLNWEKLRQRHPFNHQLFRGLGGGCGKRTCGSWVGPGRVEEVVGAALGEKKQLTLR